MQIYDVSVRFMRRRQVREYEPVEAEVTTKVQLDENDHPKAAAFNAMADAQELVLAAVTGRLRELGASPEIASDPMDAEKAAEPTTQSVVEPTPELTRGQKAAATRAKNKAAKEAATEAVGDPAAIGADPTPPAGIPGHIYVPGEETPSSDAPAPLSASQTDTSGEVSDEELRSTAATAAAALGPEAVKAEIAAAGATRLSELPAEKRSAFVAVLRDKMALAGGEAKAAETVS